MLAPTPPPLTVSSCNVSALLSWLITMSCVMQLFMHFLDAQNFDKLGGFLTLLLDLFLFESLILTLHLNDLYRLVFQSRPS